MSARVAPSCASSESLKVMILLDDCVAGPGVLKVCNVQVPPATHKVNFPEATTLFIK